ncbi:MAG TPA: multidrug ABC transporter ATP-binding protein, partial [Treponema sp.]|nr:multidrug ABC transporter ATP-binding protein [Treponema sp.]
MRGNARPRNARKVIGRLLAYIGEYRALLGIVFIAVVVSAGAGVACDSLLKPAINNYILPLCRRAQAGEQLGASDFLPFLRLIVFMACIFALGAFSSWINARLMLHISTRTLFRIRTDLFRKLEKLPLRFFDSRTHGDLMSLFTNDTDTLRDMMSQSVPQLFSSIISVVSVFVMMIVVSPLLTAVMVLSMVFIMMLAGAIGKRSASAFRDQQRNIGAVNGYIEEMIEGQKVV